MPSMLSSKPAAPSEPSSTNLLAMRWRDLVAALGRQPFAFKMALAYLVMEYVRPQTVWKVLDVLPWTQVIIIVCSIAVFSARGQKGLVKAPSSGLMLGFFFAILFSIVGAARPGDSFDHWDMFIPWLIIYFMLINAVDTREKFFLFVLVYVACSFKMSQHGFRSWASSGFGFRSWGVTGAPGWFNNSGEVGIQMCIFFPMSLYLLLALKEHLSRRAFWLMAIIPVTAAATILAANSRGAVLGGVAAMCWSVAVSKYRSRALLGALLAVVIGYFVLPDEFLARFSSMGEDTTSQTRLTYWKNGLTMLLGHPVFGIGFWNWGSYYAAHFPAAVEGYYKGVELPHNIFVQVGAELGFVGLFFYVALIASSFVMNRQTRAIARARGDRFSEVMATGFDSAMVGFLVSAQFISVAYYPYLWIALAMTVMLRSSALDHGTQSREGRRRGGGRARNQVA